MSCAPRIRLHVHLTDAALRGADPRAVCQIEGLGPVTGGHPADLARPHPTPPSPSGPCSPPTSPPPTPTKSRDPCAKPSGCGTPPRVYPWSQTLSRTLDRTLDLDHTTALPGPRAAAAHPAKPTPATSARSPGGSTGTKPSATSTSDNRHPGVFLWRSRHGWIWLVTNTGTHPLGRSPSRPRHLGRRRTEGRTATPTDHGSSSKTGAPLRHRIDLIRPSAKAQLILRT